MKILLYVGILGKYIYDWVEGVGMRVLLEGYVWARPGLGRTGQDKTG